MKRSMINYVVIILLIVFSGWSLMAAATENMGGKAIYISKENGLQLTEPGQPLPQEIASLNIFLWSTVLIVLLCLLVSLRLLEAEDVLEHKKLKKKVKKSKK